MKLYCAFVIALITVSLAACKKGNSTSTSISGKWQETKLRLYEFDDNNAIAHDTTYLAPFTKLDYVQFNINGTCSISSDYYYYPNDDTGYPTTPQATKQIIATLNYTGAGSNKYVLSQPGPPNPGGFDVRDTVTFIDGNNLLIRATDYGHGGNHVYSITDSYYSH